ncbi:MAG: hypothetical protein KAR39_12810 [Thermoplasmata archaeon]|nr:hypothetical protein [Thermoplasmata archaeon]
MNDVTLLFWLLLFLIGVTVLVMYMSWQIFKLELEVKDRQEEIEWLNKDVHHTKTVVRAILYKMKGDYFTLEERTALNIILTGDDGLGGE